MYKTRTVEQFFDDIDEVLPHEKFKYPPIQIEQIKIVTRQDAYDEMFKLLKAYKRLYIKDIQVKSVLTYSALFRELKTVIADLSKKKIVIDKQRDGVNIYYVRKR